MFHIDDLIKKIDVIKIHVWEKLCAIWLKIW